ncbi:hypothetical protein BVC71_10835 [Marivivens niveibacter]|uniref:DUF3035 domain-containing protein n=1 Tax=Marivivens niveibacter TaxID=1930667 RepID=A0A251WXH8_9RHOB|nr:hypothetical protein [Marivivens niveibacter]OUD09189.1 hypothetical protein BVC71_10835 [Marivivens niveibacter]
MRIFLLLSCLSLTACADFPQLDALNDSIVVPDYPSFIPFDQISTPTDTTAATTLEQRAANLRARAAALRNTTP